MILRDDFNRSDRNLDGDEATFGGVGQGWVWADVAGTGIIVDERFGVPSGAARVRAQIDLASPDHYSQIRAVVQGSESGRSFGAMVRCSASADTCYVALVTMQTTNTFRWFRVLNGSATQLRSINATPPTVPFDLRLEAEGQELRLFIDDGQISTPLAIDDEADEALETNVRAGWQINQPGVRGDDFEAADLLPDEPSIPAALLRRPFPRAMLGRMGGTPG